MAVSNPVRRALESAFQQAASQVGLDPATQLRWPNVAFDTKTVPEYARFSFHDFNRLAATLGPRPRVSRNGSVVLGVYVRAGSGQDRADQIMGQQPTGDGSGADGGKAGSGLLAGFGYPVELIRDDVRVRLDLASSAGDAVEVDGWWYLSTSVPWNTWS